MIKENLPKLILHHPKSKSQVNNICTPRHKLQLSFEYIQDSSNIISTPSHCRTKDHLTLLDEGLDTKEISRRNTFLSNPYEEFNIYREHLEMIAMMIKKNNPRLAFTISRGINGCSKVISSLKFFESTKASEETLLPKIYKQDNYTQTSNHLKDNENKPESEDLRFFKSLSVKLNDISFTKVSDKLRDLHRSLKKISTEVPELTTIPEIAKFDADEAIMSLEKHVRSIQCDISSQMIKKKLKNLTVASYSQTD